jgi:hypothetical protein
MWRSDAKATRANVAKRLNAAEDALNSAEALLAKMGESKVATSVRNAGDWIGSARLQLEKNKGKRTKT